MPEDYYGDGESTAVDSGAPEESGGDQPHTDKTAVVPSELCPGMKVGDEMTVKIVSVDDDSYEISYVPEGGEGEEAPAPAPAPEGSMGSMME